MTANPKKPTMKLNQILDTTTNTPILAKNTPLLRGTETLYFQGIGVDEKTKKRFVKCSKKENGRGTERVNPLALRQA